MGLFGGKNRKEYKAADVYLGLRRQVFDLPKKGGGPFGCGDRLAALMETGLDDACYTLVAVSDGSASLYFSNGGGVIGAGQRKAGAAKAKEFLSLSKEFDSRLERVSEYPVPKPGMTRFYVVKTDGSVLSGEFKEDDLGNGRSLLSPLFHKGHELITVIRLIDERKSEPPLLMAIWDGDVDTVRELLKGGASPNSRDSKGLPALLHAVSSQHEEIVGLLLSCGADPRTRLTDREAKLCNAPVANLAASSGNVGILKRLLDSGANPNDADESGLTPLMLASCEGNVKALECLIESGSRLDQKDASGYTALMFAANSGHYECVKALVNGGADVNAADNDGSRPIMFAAQHGYNDIVRLLLAKGADPRVKGQHGFSAIGFAQQNRQKDTERILTGEIS